MNTTSRDTSVNRYWDMLKDLGVDSKLALIHRTLGQCFGAWATDGSYSSDQLLNDIDKVCEDEKDFIDDFISYEN